MFFIPKVFTSPSVIFCAAPLSATCFPSIAPRLRIITRKPKVFPIPFSIDNTIRFKSIPCKIPMDIDTIIKEIKAFNLKKSISKKVAVD